MNRKIIWILSSLIILIISAELGMLFAHRNNNNFPPIPTDDSVKYSVDHITPQLTERDGLAFVNAESDTN